MKCPFGNHYHYTRRSYRLCFHRTLDRDIESLLLGVLNMGLEMALKHEQSKRHHRALRAEKKKREEIMTEKCMYRLRLQDLEHHKDQIDVMLVIFGASNIDMQKFCKDLESLILGIGEVES